MVNKERAVIKRDGTEEAFSYNKIINAVTKAFRSVNQEFPTYLMKAIPELFEGICTIEVEEIQDKIEQLLMKNEHYDAAKSYILYREKHKEARFIKDRIDYMDKYSNSNSNAASASETDANANVTMKNVANLEGEVYKVTNRVIQRQRMKDMLNKMYPEIAKQYEEDLDNHIIYTHDEASTPVLKQYCMAVSLYPLMLDGVGNIDGVTPTAPNDIQSFSGQVTNLAFLLSSQCKGAVAFGEYLIALNYYVIMEFGDTWYEKLDAIISTDYSNKKYTIKDAIRKGMKQFIYGVNQPAGNRSYNSPFTNISFYDHTYFDALFKDFYYPNGTQPKWEAVNSLQRIFMELHRELRLIKPLTFPVTTMAMVHNGEDVIDTEYKNLCAEEWAKGGSFFCYLSDNPSSLASCCRVLNEIQENTFSSINGLQGIMTGSCNVITLNINRIIQDWFRTLPTDCNINVLLHEKSTGYNDFKKYLINILNRVYKYHIAYKTMLYDLEDKGMFAASNGGYIYIKKLYSTIGIIGYMEAAKFIGFEIGNNENYINFLQMILGTIKEQNKLHNIQDKKRPFLFNSEAIPGENVAVKMYNWDKEAGYKVPEDQNLYSSYFFSQWNDNTTIFDKLVLHGSKTASYTDGGQACHIHLEEHLSKEQYSKIIDFAIKSGSSYFTFNIPMSECKECGHIVNAPTKECPKCKSNNIDWWVRIIGYLRPISAFSKDRQLEANKRYYAKIC